MRRLACFVHTLTVALSLCLALTCLCCTGYTQGERVALHALRHLDIPYVLGQAGPLAYDCSGLIKHCFAREGVALPHSAQEIGTAGDWPYISEIARLLPGDIVCFDTVKDADPSDHVGIWLGGNRFVHASSAKGAVVISEMEGYYLEKFTGARRIARVYF